MPGAKLREAKISRNRPSHPVTGYKRFMEVFLSQAGHLAVAGSAVLRWPGRTQPGVWQRPDSAIQLR